ncbi:helix-turn-helix domain-containing protein [Ruminococcus sp.]|uniref:helix-turn-helix domain-containing protein n=1 Tax=Ruminococcus sp. TaxID=41978 RepID=UPI00386AD36D
MSRVFGIRLYSLRTNKTNYTQTQMAKLLRLERSTYTKYESGITEPSLQTLRNIKKVLNITYDELLSEELSETEIIDYSLFRKTV